MTQDQWVVITVEAGNTPLKIGEAQHPWGKFHNVNNKAEEYAPGVINEIRIPQMESAKIAACGRQGASSGTEGSFNIYDADNDHLIGTYYWCCPYGSKHNTSTWTVNDPAYYDTSATNGNDTGALGYITIRCERR